MRTQVSTHSVASGATLLSDAVVIAGASAIAVEVPVALTSCQAFLLAGTTGDVNSAGLLQRVKDSSGTNVTLAVAAGSYAALITEKVVGFHSFALEFGVAQAAPRTVLIHKK